MKNKIYLLLILILNFIFIGEVKADTCDYLADRSWGDTNGNFNTASQPGYNQVSKDFTSPISIPNGYSYIKVPMYIVLTSTNNQISNINLYETCTNATNVFDTYTIKYQDGSTANVDAENYRTICNQYKTNGTAVLPYEPEIQNIILRLTYSNNGVILCDLDSNLMATCKLPNNYNNLTITGYRFAYTLNKQSSTVQGGFASILVGLCKDSDKQIIEQQQQTNTKLDNIDSSIKSSNTSGGESAADDLKNNSAFQDNSGLSSVVSMPLTFVNSLSNTCQPISLNIPYFDVDMQIPCLQSIITDKMPALANILKVVINGFIIYRVLLDIFQIIRNAKNPEDDRIEVLDL